MITAEWTNRDNLSIETTGQNSKAILVIDMPKSCRECRLYRPYEYRQAVHCAGNFRNINFSDSETDKPSWCPLRPLPQKLKVKVDTFDDIMHTEFQMTDVIADKLIANIRFETDKLVALGYNSCLDEIIGDNDDEV